MLSQIRNGRLLVETDDRGAQMMRIYSASGTEYLWDGNAEYWADRALNLFPYIGRLTEGSYTMHGKKYSMGIHGFAASSLFRITGQSENSITYSLCADEETLKQYPFDFSLDVAYSLVESRIIITYKVTNRDRQTMYFGIGGHPGFRVPLEEGLTFEDYYLEFAERCQPFRVGMSEDCFVNGQDEVLELEEGRILKLHHGLFDHDAIILKNMASEIRLKSGRSRKEVVVRYPDMPYLGIWHAPGTNAPYVCIEPWSSLPARKNIIEELSCQSDLVRLAGGLEYRNTWEIEILE